MLFALVLAATTPAQHIAAGEQALNALEYDLAGEELMMAATDPSATDDERLQANLLAGIAHRIAGKDTDAQLNFRYVLLHAPSTTLPPDTPPKVSTFFESVRQEIAAERASTTTPPPSTTTPPPATTTPPQRASSSIVSPIVAGAGALVFVVGIATAGVTELALENPSHDGKSVDDNIAIGRFALGATAVGAIVGVSGAALWFSGGP